MTLRLLAPATAVLMLLIAVACDDDDGPTTRGPVGTVIAEATIEIGPTEQTVQLGTGAQGAQVTFLVGASPTPRKVTVRLSTGVMKAGPRVVLPTLQLANPDLILATPARMRQSVAPAPLGKKYVTVSAGEDEAAWLVRGPVRVVASGPPATIEVDVLGPGLWAIAEVDDVQPLNLGPGSNAAVAVDQVGTAFVAWVGPETGTTSLQFCRLPRAAVACDIRTGIPAQGTSISRPFVAVNANTVQVLSYRYGLTTGDFAAVILFTSIDGGLTFDGGQRVGTTPFSAAAPGPQGTLSLTTNAYPMGLAYQSVPLGAAAPATREAILSNTHLYGGAVGLADALTPVVVFANGNSDAQVRRYLGTGDVNDETTWSPAQDIGKADSMHLASGTNGLFLLARGASNTLEVRRYVAGTFAAGVAVPNGTGELPQAYLLQDVAGRLHVLWPRIEAAGIQLHHAVSDDGNSWQHGLITQDEGFVGVRAALAPDRTGIAVWTTSQAASAAIHAIPLGSTPAQ